MDAHQPRSRSGLPSAIASFEHIEDRLSDHHPAVFLDYDGVLTPIVAHPDLALLAPETRVVVGRLARIMHVAVISGRDTADVMSKIGIEGVWYAGSHGFDIVAPGGNRPDRHPLPDISDYERSLSAAADRLDRSIGPISGAHVERKRFAVAVHFRQAAPEAERQVEAMVAAQRDADRRLRMTSGKKVFELRPAIEWDKGRALEWIMTTLELDERTVPFYLGDDVTDEDAFRILLDDRGVAVVVGTDGPPTLANYRLDDPTEVRSFLSMLGEVTS